MNKQTMVGKTEHEHTDITVARGLPSVLKQQAADLAIHSSSSELSDGFRAALKEALIADGRDAKKNPHLVVPWSLKAEEVAMIDRMFPFFQYHFKDYEHSPHPVSVSVRYVATEYLLKVMRYAGAGVVCLGGDFSAHVAKNRDYVHTCMPVNTVHDAADIRGMIESIQLRTYLSANEQRAAASVDFFAGGRKKYMCDAPEKCKVTAGVVIADHMALDIPIEQVGYTMVQKHSSRGFGFFLFVPEMLYNSRGYLASVDAHYVINRKLDYIDIIYPGATSKNMRYNWTNYVAMATKTHFKIGNLRFLLEIIHNTMGLCCYRLTRVDQFNFPAETITHNLWYSALADYVELSVPKLRKGYVNNPDHEESYYTRKFLAPRRIFEYTLEKAESAQSHELNRRELLGYAFALNTRHIFFGQIAKCPTRMSFDDLNDMITVVFYMAYRKRYEQTTLTAKLIKDLKQQRNISVSQDDLDKTFLRKLLTTANDYTFSWAAKSLRTWLLKDNYGISNDFGKKFNVSTPKLSVTFRETVEANTRAVLSSRDHVRAIKHFSTKFPGWVFVKLLNDPEYLAKALPRLPQSVKDMFQCIYERNKSDSDKQQEEEAATTEESDSDDDDFVDAHEFYCSEAGARESMDQLPTYRESEISNDDNDIAMHHKKEWHELSESEVSSSSCAREVVDAVKSNSASNKQPEIVYHRAQTADTTDLGIGVHDVDGVPPKVEDVEFRDVLLPHVKYSTPVKRDDNSPIVRLGTAASSDNGAFCRVARKYAIPEAYTYLTQAIAMTEFVFNSPIEPNPINNPVQVMQDCYDQMFPGLSIVDYSQDAGQVNYSDLEISFDALKMNLSTSAIQGLKDIKCVKSRLRTSAGPNRPQATKETLIALQKRNLDVPFLEENNSFEDVLQSTWETSINEYFIPGAREKLAEYVAHKVVPTIENCRTWTERLDPKVAEALLRLDFNLLLCDPKKYELMIKSQVKPKCDKSAIADYSALQTVVYHTKEINAAFSSCFLELRDRLMSLLKPNVVLNMKKSRKDLEDIVRMFEPKFTRPNYVEIDHSKYDKSQQWTCLRMEWFVYEQLGLDLGIGQIWKEANIDCLMTSAATGIKLWSILQRRSGSATTALGNTIVNLLTLAGSAHLHRGFYYILLLGDDSLICVPGKIDDGRMTDYFATVFNLSSKVTQSYYGRFCSMFVTRYSGGIKLLSDPIKRIEKLGGPIATDEFEKVEANFVSLGDTLYNYDDELAFPELNAAVNYHYESDVNIVPACHALRTVSTDYGKFKEIYDDKVSKISY